MQSYRKLAVWRKAHLLALAVFHVTLRLSRRGAWGLCGQIRRAAESIPANIAEGRMRGSDRDFAKFITIAISSSTELEYHLEFAKDARLIAASDFDRLQRGVVEVRRMLVGLLKKLREPIQADG
jgi:four helix bundle protein